MSEPEREDAPPAAAEGGDAPPAGGDEPRGEGDRGEGAQYDRPPRREGPPDITNMFSLRVTNLSYETSRQTIRNMFEDTTPGAEITDVYIPRDRATGQPRGFAFVRYREKAAAEDAMAKLDGVQLDGRRIGVGYAQFGRNNEPIKTGFTDQGAPRPLDQGPPPRRYDGPPPERGGPPGGYGRGPPPRGDFGGRYGGRDERDFYDRPPRRFDGPPPRGDFYDRPPRYDGPPPMGDRGGGYGGPPRGYDERGYGDRRDERRYDDRGRDFDRRGGGGYGERERHDRPRY